MEKYGVDLVFNAHDHAIARTYPIKAGALMKKPSEGVIYYHFRTKRRQNLYGREENGLEYHSFIIRWISRTILSLK